MKATLTAMMIALSTSGAMASSYYHGFDNPEINPTYWADNGHVAAAPSGNSENFDRYNGFAKGNPDIFNDYDAPKSIYTSGMQLPDIYGGFDDGHPDLMW